MAIDWSKYIDDPNATPKSDGLITTLQDLDDDGLDKNSKFYEERKKLLQSKPYYYSNKLESDYDRIKADTDKDGFVSKEEYETYLVNKTESVQTTKPIIVHKNDINWTTIILVSIVCVTLLASVAIFSIIKYKNKSANTGS